MFARDELPLIIDQIPAIIIANTDPSTKSGSHWILFYFDNSGNVEYFDSLGKTLTHYHKDFLKFIKNNCNYYSRVVKNRIQPVILLYVYIIVYIMLIQDVWRKLICLLQIGLNVVFLFFSITRNYNTMSMLY